MVYSFLCCSECSMRQETRPTIGMHREPILRLFFGNSQSTLDWWCSMIAWYSEKRRNIHLIRAYQAIIQKQVGNLVTSLLQVNFCVSCITSTTIYIPCYQSLKLLRKKELSVLCANFMDSISTFFHVVKLCSQTILTIRNNFLRGHTNSLKHFFTRYALMCTVTNQINCQLVQRQFTQLLFNSMVSEVLIRSIYTDDEKSRSHIKSTRRQYE